MHWYPLYILLKCRLTFPRPEVLHFWQLPRIQGPGCIHVILIAELGITYTYPLYVPDTGTGPETLRNLPMVRQAQATGLVSLQEWPSPPTVRGRWDRTVCGSGWYSIHPSSPCASSIPWELCPHWLLTFWGKVSAGQEANWMSPLSMHRRRSEGSWIYTRPPALTLHSAGDCLQ